MTHSSNALIPIKAGAIAGMATVRAIKNGEVVRELTFPNLITDLGLERLATLSSNSIYEYCQVGTGSTTPAFSDTQLTTFVSAQGRTASTSFSGSSPLWFSTLRQTYTWAVGAAVGNFTELGLAATGISTSGLFTHALFVDGGGSPVAFPVLIDEQLQVIYDLRLYPNLTDQLATVTVGPNSHDTITRPSQVTNFGWGLRSSGSGQGINFARDSNQNAQRGYTNQTLDAVDATPSGTTVVASTSCNSVAYVAASLERASNMIWAPDKGNIPVIGKVVQAYLCSIWQTRYDPPLAKTDLQTLTLGFKVSWTRY